MPKFSTKCRQCSRLVDFLAQVKQDHPDYYTKPVPAFGDDDPHLLIVGLAPGLHGANRTGRPFTGDHAGILLYQTLHKYGFSSAPVSESSHDGLQLLNCRITNAVKCLPPQNKPTGLEVQTCNGYLKDEIEQLEEGSLILALGTLAHNAVIRAMALKQKDYPFGHERLHSLPIGYALLDSYHCSRYNTQTKRLTESMFYQVFAKARQWVDAR